MPVIVSDPVHAPAPPRQARDGLIGLSGVAIVMVIVGHYWFGRDCGGVDILLVVFGFALGDRVMRGLSLSAWARPVRRLLIPLVLLLTVCAGATVVIQPQTRWEDFADQTLAGLGFYQNWLLLETAGDYAQAGEAVTPLHHLWLIAMAGQVAVAFLLVTGLVAAVTWRLDRTWRSRLLLVVTAVAAVASLYYAIRTHSDSPLLGYYSPLTRGWAILAGVLAAGAMRGPLGRLRWPGWMTSVFGSAPLVAVGALAYPLYLWHWPVLIFWLAAVNDDTVGVADGIVVLLVAVVAAWLTGALVTASERTRRARGVAVAGTAVLAALLVATSLMWTGHVARARTSGAELGMLPARDYPGARALLDNRRVARLPMRPTVLEAPDDTPPSTADHCVTGFGGDEVITCVYGDPRATRTIALAGGSHSEHWLTALHLIGRHQGFKVTTYLKAGCPLTTKEVPIIAGSFQPYPSCRTWSDHALAQIIADRPDYVFFTSTRPILNGPGDYVPDYYLGIWDALSDNGIPMLGIRDTPWMVQEGMFFSPVDCLSAGGDGQSCGLPRDEALSQHNPTLDHLADYPLMRVLDLSDAVCRRDICRAVEGNVLVYHDAHHLSGTYVRTLAGELQRQLGDTTGWW